MNRFEISLRTVTTCVFVPLERIVNYHTCDVYILFSVGIFIKSFVLLVTIIYQSIMQVT